MKTNSCLNTVLLLFTVMCGLAQSAVYVDWRYPDTDSDGSSSRPFYTVEQGYGRVAAGGTLKIRRGHYLLESMLEKPLLLEAYEGEVELRTEGPIDLLQRPYHPSNVRATLVQNRGIRLDWEDSGWGASYTIDFAGTRRYHVDHNFSRTAGRGQESYTVENLYDGFTYCVTIKAFNRVGRASADPVCVTIPESGPPSVSGYRRVAFYNCHSDKRPVHVWTYDLTTGTWTQHGTLAAQWSNGGCPGSALPLIIPLVDGRSYQVVAVDPALIGCGGENNPAKSSCQKLITTTPFKGDDDGPTLNVGVELAIWETRETASSGRLSNPKYSPSAGFQFTFGEGSTGQTYRIQSSPAATAATGGAWTDLTNFTYTGPSVVTDAAAPPTPNKFYRAVSP